MGYIIRLPGLGMQTDRATLVAWHASPGDRVQAGEVIAEIETEKATAEIEAREDGLLRRQYVREGDVAKPGNPLGIVAEADDDISDLEAKAKRDGAEAVEPVDKASSAIASDATPTEVTSPSREESEANVSARVSPRARRRAEDLGVDLSTIDGSGPGGAITEDDVTAAAQAETAADTETEEVKATPRARQRAEELGVELSTIEGSGPGGAIVEEDVETVGEETGPRTEPARTVREERSPSEMRRTIADRLGQSYREAVHVTVHREADAEGAFAAVEAAQHEVDTDASLIDIVLLALSATLEEYPEFNATFEDGVHRLYEEHNVGLAVDVEGGLVTPVLADIGNSSLADLVAERRRLTQRALSGEYTMAELRGGTFTVSNLGPFNIESFTPIINPPMIGILGVGGAVERAQRGGDGAFEFRRLLPLDLSFDHRVVDGADAARFLETLVDHIETPWPLLPDAVSDGRIERADSSLPEREVTAETNGGFQGTVTAGSVEWDFDEPTDVGGSGSAPTPVDMFLGSLAACLAVSIGFQAEKRQIDIDEIDVDVHGSPDRGPLEEIDISIHFDADGVDEDELDRLVELGERGCYVSELLKDAPDLNLSWTSA